jgi:hypothetical protein
VGDVFVWTWRGRAEVVGTSSSYPATDPRGLDHELRSLPLTVLGRDPSRAAPLDARGPRHRADADRGGPVPAHSAPQRVLQMWTPTRDSSASSEDAKGESRALRLLPQPLECSQRPTPTYSTGPCSPS